MRRNLIQAMGLNRHSRFVTALVALFSVLFMQFAVAAYACPTVRATADTALHDGWASAESHRDMAGCEGGVDVDQPALCFAYAQEGSQFLYKPPAPDVPPAVVIDIVRYVVDTGLELRPVSPHAQPPGLTRISDPPLSIRNCCFRI